MSSHVPSSGNNQINPATPAVPVNPTPVPIVPITGVVSETLASDTQKKNQLLALSLERLEEILTLVEESQTGASAVTLGTGLHEVMSFIKTELSKDPAEVSKVMKALAPILKPDAKNLNKQLQLLKKLTGELKSDLAKLDAQQFQKDYQEHIQPVFMRAAKKMAEVNDAVDKAKLGPNQSYSDEPTIKNLFASGSSDSDLVGQAAMFMQLFMCASAKSQAEKSQTDTAVGGALVNQAENTVKKVQEEIQKAEEEAAHRPWWQKLVQVVAVVASVVIGAFTGGVGGLLVGALMAAVMSSPVFNEGVNAIAKAVAAALEPVLESYYLSKGESASQAKQDAEASANGIGQIVGKIAMIAALTIATGGVGGVTYGLEAAAEEGVTAAADEAAATVSGDAVASAESGAAKSSSKLGYSAKQGAQMAKFQGFTSFMTSGVWSNAMEADPHFAKKHPELMLGLNIACTIIGAGVSMFAGSKIMSQAISGEDGFKNFMKSLKCLIPASYGAESAQAGIGVYSSVKAEEALKTQADATKQLGILEGFNTVIDSALGSLNFTQRSSTEALNEVSKQMSEAMSKLVQSAGITWDRTGSNLAS
jgi:hypothetical protein